MLKRRKILTILAIFIFVTIALTGCGNNNEEAEISEIIKKQINVQNITIQTEVQTPLIVSGTITPKEHSIVRSLAPGTIQYLALVGSEIQAGQPLFSIRDASIQDSYFNSLRNLEQTEVVTNQRTLQAELVLSGAEVKYNLAKSQLDRTIEQAEQALKTVEDSSLVVYSSAYNTMSQIVSFLNTGDTRTIDYIYRNILTGQSQFRTDTEIDFMAAINDFLSLSVDINNNDLVANLKEAQTALLSVKTAVDNTVLLLQNAILSSSNTSQIASDKVIMTGYQTAVNTNISSVISAINSIANTKINNQLTIDGSEGQLDLAEIEKNNAAISLDSSKDGALLEANIARSQVDSAAYNYYNLTLAAPFSGTIISHFVNPGEQVSIGQELIEIGNLELIETTVAVDVAYAKTILLGDEVMIDEQFKGVVTEVEPVGDLLSGKVEVTVQSQEAARNLIVGASADVKFKLTYMEEGMIVIPIKSATIEASGTYVFIVVDGVVARKEISLGQIFGDKVLVNSGLDEGDQLVLVNGTFIAIGDEVDIIKQ
jgi:membrane fusion protein, multidrug efflux system